MRKLVIAAAFAVGLFMLAPVSSASAAGDSFTGACTIPFGSGAAGFSPNIKTPPASLTYNFNGSGSCVGALNNVPGTYPLTANAGGSGQLGCSASVSTEGSGGATIGGKTFNFSISLVGEGTEVQFVLTNPKPPATGTATGGGRASFAQDTTGLAACASPNGTATLKFEVQAAATLTN